MLNQMELKLNFNDHVSWALYLEAFDADSETQSEDLEFMRLHQTPPSASYSPISPSYDAWLKSLEETRPPSPSFSPPTTPEHVSKSQDSPSAKRKREQEKNLRRLKSIRHEKVFRQQNLSQHQKMKCEQERRLELLKTVHQCLSVVTIYPVFEGMAAVTKFTKTYDITKMDKMEEAGTNFVSDWHIE